MKKIIIFIIVIFTIAIGYWLYKRGFEAGRDSTAQTDSSAPKKWVSQKWGYEITFPWQWENIKRDDYSIKSMGADVFCNNRRGASTAVFVYPIVQSDTLDGLTDRILKEYNKFIGEIKVTAKFDVTKDGFPCRTIIFSEKGATHHYTLILTDKVNIAISSNCPSDEFESNKKDFEDIVNALKFL